MKHNKMILNESNMEEQAYNRVRQKAKFYKHLAVYLAVNFIAHFSAIQHGRFLGPIGMTVFWGIGLLFHYLKVFGVPGTGILSTDWEDREYTKELERLKNRNHQKQQREEELELKQVEKKYRDNELV